MYRLQVAPLTKLPGHFGGTLTYQYSDPLPEGIAVIVSLHNRNVTGIIIFCQLLTDYNIEPEFEIKPITSVLSLTPLLTKTQIQLAKWMSGYYAYPLGLILKLFLPRLTRVVKRYPKILQTDSQLPSKNVAKSIPPRIYLGNIQNRIAYYRMLKKDYPDRQILIICPDIQSLTHLASELRDLEPLVIQSALPTKEFRRIWVGTKQGSRGIIISTRTGLFFPYTNLGWIAIEDDTSENHTMQEMRPKYHTQTLVEQLATIHSVPYTQLSHLPSLHSLHKLTKFSMSLIPNCIPSRTSPLSIVSMPDHYRTGNHRILADPTVAYIDKLLNSKIPIIVLVNRRGESTYISCDECGHHLRDPYTGSLLVEHRLDILSKTPRDYHETHVLVSHKSHKWFKMVHKCPKCNSINLRRGGIGIERIARFLEEQFPSTHLDILSSDTISHSHEANNKISEFVNKKEGILLTTNMIFKFLPALSSVAFGLVIPSVDAMTGLPDYSTLEKAIHKLYAFQLSAQSICVQSFQDWNSETHTTSPFIHRFVSESPLTLLNEELLQRDTYTYPPFVEIIALRNTNKFRSKALKLAQDTKKVLRSMGIKARGPIESYHSRGQGQFIFTLIIQCSPLEAETLKATITPVLSPFQSIEINPSQLFS